MMVSVQLIKHVHGCFASVSSMDVWLERQIMLPFAPFAGLKIEEKIEDPNDKYAAFDEKVTEVYWDLKAEKFRAYVQDDKELYDAGLHKTAARPIAEIVAEYEKVGWKIREQR